MQVNINILPAYQAFALDESRYNLLRGGYGSGKSYAVAQKLILRALSESGHQIYAFRKVRNTVRDSVYKTLKAVVENSGLSGLVDIRESDFRFRFKNGSEITCMGLDNPEKLKSINCSIAALEEPVPEMTREDFKMIKSRIRVPGVLNQMILSFNPRSKASFVYKDFYESDEYADRTFELVTTYKDNPYNPVEYGQELEAESDEVEHAIGAKGEWASNTELLIYPKWEMVDKFPYDEIKDWGYGVDWGFKNPMAVIRCGFNPIDKSVYLEEVFYQTETTTTALISKLPVLGIDKSDVLVCDSAEPDRIQELSSAGYRRAQPCKKTKKSINFGIDLVKSYPIKVVEGSINLSTELDLYRWKTDRQGNILDAPLDKNDHACDAFRYWSLSYLKKKSRREVRATFLPGPM